MVHEQDEAWSALGVEQGCLYRPSRVLGRPGAVEQVPLGRWSPEYGRGIRALLRVDRRIRTAAVPFLYKSLGTRAANAPYFRVNVLGQGLGLLVHELDCRAVKPEEVISLACALKGLPNLSSVIVGNEILSLRRRQPPSAEEDFLVQAMKSALGRILSLTVTPAMPLDVAFALKHVDKRRFRRLVIKSAESILPRKQKLVDVLEGLEGLVDVELDASEEEQVAEMQRCLRLPHVRTLVLKCSQESFEPDYSDALLLAHHIAPAVEVLSLVDLHDDGCVGRQPQELPRTLLSKLRVLRISTSESTDVDVLGLARLPALEHLHISSESSGSNIFPGAASLSSYPPTIRTITLAYVLDQPSFPPSSLLAKCDELGIRLFAEWRPPTLDWAVCASREVPVLGQASAPPCASEAADLERVFGWAGDRVRWLLRLGDGRAMQELSAAPL
ncbi:hypothetical protein JCM8208_004287 [Rhodotorula glutinis]